MSRNRQHKEENRGAKQLKKDQNQKLFSLIGSRCSTLASAVAQVFHAEGNNWIKKACGVACFVKDNLKRSYYIRVFNLKSNNVIWEQEIYNQFKCKAKKDYFLTFEMDDCVAGLNFSDVNDASFFKKTLQTTLENRSRRRKERLKKRNSNQIINKQDILSGSRVSSSGTKTKRSSLSKSDISDPKHFRHVGHVGWDPNDRLSMNDLDPELKQLLDSVGISESEMQDGDTAAFIYDFIEKHGGVEALKSSHREAASLPPAPPPPRAKQDAAPPLPGRGRKMSLPSPASPPPRDTRRPSLPQVAPQLPARGQRPPAQLPAPTREEEPPPPLPPGRKSSGRNVPMLSQPGHDLPPPRPAQSRGQPQPVSPRGAVHPPLPPPAPPPPGIPEAPSFAPPPPALSSHSGSPAAFSPPGDGRGDLMAAIRNQHGKQTLKHVSQEAPRARAPVDDMASKLREAIANRSLHIHGQDESEEEEDEFDDDDWD